MMPVYTTLTKPSTRAAQAEAFVLTTFPGFHDEWVMLRRAEMAFCHCGLLAAGFCHTWAIRHAASCPAAELFD